MPESDLTLRKEDTKQRVANSFDVVLNREFYNPASLPFWPTDCLHQGVPAHGSCSSMRWNGNGHAALSSPQPAHKHLARSAAVNAHRPPSNSDTLKELSALNALLWVHLGNFSRDTKLCGCCLFTWSHRDPTLDDSLDKGSPSASFHFQPSSAEAACDFMTPAADTGGVLP